MAVLTLVRGLPGSGKSTVAEALLKAGVADIKCEADDYRMRSGEYVFNPDENAKAHNVCYERAQNGLKIGKNVVVANTFVKNWEMARYIDLATVLDAVISVIECKGEFANIHDVPEEVIERMRSNWEEFSLEDTSDDVD